MSHRYWRKICEKRDRLGNEVVCRVVRRSGRAREGLLIAWVVNVVGEIGFDEV